MRRSNRSRFATTRGIRGLVALVFSAAPLLLSTAPVVAATAVVPAAATRAPAAAATAAKAPRPNIIILLGDDMGFSDLGCYGGEIETPVLDRLAAGGLRFTQFYNTSRCCPTRASLLSGLYPHQAGVGWMMVDRGVDGYRGELARDAVSIPEALESAGYSSYMAGKWHVTKYTKPEGPKDNWPLQRGFDRFYGTITGAGSYWDPSTLTRDNTMISPFADPEYRPAEPFYYTDAIADHVVRFISEHHRDKRDRPFFIYTAFTAAHWPMHARPADIARYRGRYDGGYEPIRERRFRRAKELGLIDPSWDLSPQAEDWDAVKDRRWEAACMEVYAAAVSSMDRAIGRIVAELKKDGLFDDTLIFFLQDNGGCAEGYGRRPRGGITKRPEKPTLPPMDPAALQREMAPRQTRDGYPVVMGPGILPGPADTFIAYGRGWANVSNTPFREYKHWVHEGGISTPLIAHWPRGIHRHGELERQPGHLIDLMATCVDVAGATYPKRYAGHDIQPMEGRSLAPAFGGEKIEREALYWEHEGNRAVRVGKWKLVAKSGRPWELYDMERDRTEMHDLSAKHPERVEELAELWNAYAARAKVLPLGIWRGRKSAGTFSRKKRFELSSGATLPRDKAPSVGGRPFRVSVELKSRGTKGVLVAQGGSSDGWTLYLREGKLTFATRRSGRLAAISGALPGAEAGTPLVIEARLERGGGVEIVAGGRVVARGSAGGLLDRMPLDGLEVGRDEKGAVGEYDAPFPFDGELEKVSLRIGK